MASSQGFTDEEKRSVSVRVNSAKVTPLAEKSRASGQPSSKFMQWRARRGEKNSSAVKGQQNQQATAEKSNSDLSSQTAQSVSAQKLSWRERGRKSWKKILGAVVALALVVALFVGVVFFSPLLATQKITVEGASLLSQSTLEEKLAPLEGTPLPRITEDEVKSRLGESTILRGVMVQAHAPHELIVIVHERVPVALIKKDEGFEMVDADGVELGTVKSADAVPMPLIEGGEDVVKKPQFSTIAAVLATLPQELLGQVSQASADSASTISLTMNDGTHVVWGTSEDSELKAKVLIQLRNTLGESGRIQTYDVSSPLVPTTK